MPAKPLLRRCSGPHGNPLPAPQLHLLPASPSGWPECGFAPDEKKPLRLAGLSHPSPGPLLCVSKTAVPALLGLIHGLMKKSLQQIKIDRPSILHLKRKFPTLRPYPRICRSLRMHHLECKLGFLCLTRNIPIGIVGAAILHPNSIPSPINRILFDGYHHL